MNYNEENLHKSLLEEIKEENRAFFNMLDGDTSYLKKRFSFSHNETMLQAEFYVYCKENNIPCILEVPISLTDKRFLLDAIIDINHQFVIFEFKMNFNEKNKRKRNKLINQIVGYSKLNYPIILLDQTDDFKKVIEICSQNILKNGVYEFDHDYKDLQRIDFFGNTINFLKSKLYE